MISPPLEKILPKTNKIVNRSQDIDLPNKVSCLLCPDNG